MIKQCVRCLLTAVIGVFLSVAQPGARRLVATGRVTMADGSPPPKLVGIERVCPGGASSVEAVTDRQGRFHVRLNTVSGRSAISSRVGFSSTALTEARLCLLRASLDGYDSTTVDLDMWSRLGDSSLPALILERPSPESGGAKKRGLGSSKEEPRAWQEAINAAEAERWPEAERQLRAVVRSRPASVQAWYLLGAICEAGKKLGEARRNYLRAIQADPRWLASYSALAQLDVKMKDWAAVLTTTEAWIKADTLHRYAEAYSYNAVARYYMGDLDGAGKSAQEAVRLDRKRLVPWAEYVLGMVLSAKKDSAGAAEHLQRYLELEPKTEDAGAVKSWIAKLGTVGPEDPVLRIDRLEPGLPPARDIWVPGGIKALAAAAGVKETVSFDTFFAAYCRALARGGSTGPDDQIARYQQRLLAYFRAVAELAPEEVPPGQQTTVTLSLASQERHRATERALALFGWQIGVAGDSVVVEPGAQEADCPRQAVAAFLGVDEIAMQEALEGGKDYTFAIPSETARLMGGDAWETILRRDLVVAGGMAEYFARDFRLAKAYVGLSEMETAAARVLVSAVGLHTLVLEHSELLSGQPGVFAIQDGAVRVPGGRQAEAAWAVLAGSAPREPSRFLRALFTKDKGRLADFYAAVSQSDELHQRFVTKTGTAATHHYGLFRDRTWPADLLRDLPLDDAANLRLPGGRRAWTPASGTGESLLSAAGNAEAMVTLAQLERMRRIPLDEESARILVARLGEWRSLFPYFVRLPALGTSEFRALEGFSEVLKSYPPPVQDQVLGVWHSLVELLALGVKAGSLDAGAGARMFGRICRDLRGNDFAPRALAIARSMTGPAGTLDETIPGRLLRLDSGGRTAFERVKRMQGVPLLGERGAGLDASGVVHALSGQVYAGWLDPGGLLVSEDPLFLRRQRFLGSDLHTKFISPFPANELRLTSIPPGSRLIGGFARFGELASSLAPGGGDVEPALAGARVDARASPRAIAGAGLETTVDATFRVNARLVEVYATVTDERGNYVDELSREQFQIVEEGSPQQVVAFESNASSLTCVLLLDTTGSMQVALPALKNAALRLIGQLREMDSVAVYTFRETVSAVLPVTSDKRSAKRAVLSASPDGTTALYDALVRVSREISGRSGKKVIVVFTDGADNASALTADRVVTRAKTVGTPVYSIAQGDALRFRAVLKELDSISLATGGLPFRIQKPDEIRAVFERLANDLKHGYLLAYRPPAVESREWRRITVQLAGGKGCKVRAREGYYPQ